MRKIKKTILFVTILALISGCNDVPLSNNLISTLPELNGSFEYSDKTIIKFDVANDNTVKLTQYDKNDKGTFEISTIAYELPVYFTDIRYNGKIYHFISIEVKEEIYLTKKVEIKKSGILVSDLNDSFLTEKGDGNFKTPENFKNFIIEHIENKDLFESEKQLYTKR